MNYKLRKRDRISLFFCCSFRSKLPKSTRIVHPFGISIGEDVFIGENCEIFQNVSIGRRWKDKKSNIVIGNNVRICSGVCIVGNVNIGDHAIIGANAVVLSDVPKGKTVTGVWKAKK